MIIMHAAWEASMRYFEIPENEWQPFYDWYCKTYPDGLEPISRAYEEFKGNDQPLSTTN